MSNAHLPGAWQIIWRSGLFGGGGGGLLGFLFGFCVPGMYLWHTLLSKIVGEDNNRPIMLLYLVGAAVLACLGGAAAWWVLGRHRPPAARVALCLTGALLASSLPTGPLLIFGWLIGAILSIASAIVGFSLGLLGGVVLIIVGSAWPLVRTDPQRALVLLRPLSLSLGAAWFPLTFLVVKRVGETETTQSDPIWILGASPLLVITLLSAWAFSPYILSR